MKKALEIAKKNLVSILCGVAVLILLGLVYIYPLPASRAALQEDVDKSKTTYDQLRGQLDQPRYLPKLTTDDEPAPVLNGFPGPDLVQAANKAITDLKREGDELVREAISNTGTIKPLTENLFPRVSASDSEPRVLQFFRDQYWVATATDSIGFESSRYKEILNGILPPQQSEFERVVADRSATILGRAPKSADGKPTNQIELDKEIAEMKAKLPRELKKSRAEQGKVYVGPGAIMPHPQLGTQSGANVPALDIVTAFNAQYSLWIQELVLSAIADVNKDAVNVLDAPIKHIVKLDIGTAYNFARAVPVSDPMSSIDPPFNPSAIITKDYRDDPFGHPAVNDLYELNTFDLTIRVDARKIPDVLGALTSGRFLFVNQVWIQAVDTGVALNEGFLYGSDPMPVAELRLRCNLLILRSQLTPWMPDVVKAFMKSRVAQPASSIDR